MPIVHLVRHGEVDNPDHVVYADLPGFRLSDLGREQAVQSGEYLAGRPIGAVFSSPLQRATETAHEIAKRHGVPITTVPELTEWLLAQGWKGLRWEALDEHRPGELEAYLAHPLDMPFSEESLEELAVRMTTAIEKITSAGSEGELVIVSHQDPIQAARLALTHRTLAGLNHDKPEHAEVFTLQAGDPWIELARWAPAAQRAFPPSG